jgi:hypothetical protein
MLFAKRNDRTLAHSCRRLKLGWDKIGKGAVERNRKGNIDVERMQ